MFSRAPKQAQRRPHGPYMVLKMEFFHGPDLRCNGIWSVMVMVSV